MYNATQAQPDSMEILKRDIQILWDNRNVPLDQLPESVKNAYNHLRIASSLLYSEGTMSKYEQLVSYLMSLARNNTEYAPGTIGQYLFGCYQPPEMYNEYGGNATCSPQCIYSLPQMNRRPCGEVQVWSLTRMGTLTPIIENPSREAVISTSKFLGLTPEMVNQLSHSGIERIKVIGDDGQMWYNGPLSSVKIVNPAIFSSPGGDTGALGNGGHDPPRDPPPEATNDKNCPLSAFKWLTGTPVGIATLVICAVILVIVIGIFIFFMVYISRPAVMAYNPYPSAPS